jgi:hypothetical protein
MSAVWLESVSKVFDSDVKYEDKMVTRLASFLSNTRLVFGGTIFLLFAIWRKGVNNGVRQAITK